ncbi:hypothetical protein JYU34_022622 [Plutella xylostella]|uniref:Uncharacterized protein n=1 Tax=Plutella xylostella TaxID=51655 RepID=A0ABQ7PPR0_PLUXY|nr:hypothetical protein JYU34_022641 [Plutella xylostella]KAG7294976.1 hypothetical protein JYU34_022622 [Plutella xylostella]
MMERLQRKFARYIFRRVYGYYPFLYPSLFVIGMVGMETLEVRRAVHTVVHYLRLLRGGVDNPAALSGVGLWAPARGGRPRRAACARPPALAPVVEVTTIRGQNAPTVRAIRHINNFLERCQDADIHHTTLPSLIRLCKVVLSS